MALASLRGSTCKRSIGVLTVAASFSLLALAGPTGPTTKSKDKNKDNGKKAVAAKAAKAAPAASTQAASAPAAKASTGIFDNGFGASAMQGSLTGAPGLWNTQFAETLLPGQSSSGVYVQRYARDPGGLVFTEVNTGWTVGLTNRIELSFATNPYRRIRVTHPEELTFGRLGNFDSFNPNAPFARNANIHGPVDWSLGATVGLLSQDRGDPFGLALQFTESLPYFSTFTNGANNYGVGTTEPTFTENVLADKWLGKAGEIVFNFGYQHNGTVDAGGVRIPLQDQFLYGFGEVYPLHSRLQGIVELSGSTPFGAGASANTDVYGTPRPLDLNLGIRFNPITWMGINAGYRLGAHTSSSMAALTNPTGWIFGLSFGPPPPAPVAPPPPAPALTCNVDQTPVQPGAVVHITSSVTPTGLPYTYSWTTTGGKLTPSNDTASLDTTGLAPGMYTVTGRVDNGQGGTADCTANVEVREAPKHPPTASCSVDPTTPVLPGATLTYSVNAASPDNRPLTYAWQVSEGHPDSTSQATLHDDTTGAAPGTVTGSVTVTDDRGLSATCSAEGTIQQPPPPPQASLATTLQFKPNSSRVDNAAKAALDDVALRLQQDATAKAVIVGSATNSEMRRHLSDAATTRLAEERAVNAKNYLVTEKGISADRVEVRYTTDHPHQAEVWVVPQGASYTGSGQTFDENAVKAPVRRPQRRRAPAKAKAGSGGGLE